VVVAGAYLEDFSRGFAANPAYVLDLTRRLLGGGVKRVFLADTLGVLAPEDVERQVRAMISAFPEACFEFHGHDDYGLATANVLAAVRAGARGVHTTVNGLGERAGNARLCEVVLALHDHAAVRTSVREQTLCEVARLVETCSGKVLADNAPIVGRDAFTQTAGIHADGDRKGELYASRLSPERVGRQRSYALGKLAGRASLEQNLEQLGIALSEQDRARLLERVVELGDRKQHVEASDLGLLLGCDERARILRRYAVTVRDDAHAQASLELAWAGRSVRASATARSSHAERQKLETLSKQTLEGDRMQTVEFVLSLTAVLSTGLMAGALLAEACLLVPYWRALSPADFLAHYRGQAQPLLRFFGPLEVASCALVISAGVAAAYGTRGYTSSWLGAAGALLAILLSFGLYFKKANASFADATIELREVASELTRWARWHWLRTLLAVLAFMLTILASGVRP